MKVATSGTHYQNILASHKKILLWILVGLSFKKSYPNLRFLGEKLLINYVCRTNIMRKYNEP
jgi:hypothetical protein